MEDMLWSAGTKLGISALKAFTGSKASGAGKALNVLAGAFDEDGGDDGGDDDYEEEEVEEVEDAGGEEYAAEEYVEEEYAAEEGAEEEEYYEEEATQDDTAYEDGDYDDYESSADATATYDQTYDQATDTTYEYTYSEDTAQQDTTQQDAAQATSPTRARRGPTSRGLGLAAVAVGGAAVAGAALAAKRGRRKPRGAAGCPPTRGRGRGGPVGGRPNHPIGGPPPVRGGAARGRGRGRSRGAGRGQGGAGQPVGQPDIYMPQPLRPQHQIAIGLPNALGPVPNSQPDAYPAVGRLPLHSSSYINQPLQEPPQQLPPPYSTVVYTSLPTQRQKADPAVLEQMSKRRLGALQQIQERERNRIAARKREEEQDRLRAAGGQQATNPDTPELEPIVKINLPPGVVAKPNVLAPGAQNPNIGRTKSTMAPQAVEMPQPAPPKPPAVKMPQPARPVSHAVEMPQPPPPVPQPAKMPQPAHPVSQAVEMPSSSRPVTHAVEMPQPAPPAPQYNPPPANPAPVVANNYYEMDGGTYTPAPAPAPAPAPYTQAPPAPQWSASAPAVELDSAQQRYTATEYRPELPAHANTWAQPQPRPQPQPSGPQRSQSTLQRFPSRKPIQRPVSMAVPPSAANAYAPNPAFQQPQPPQPQPAQPQHQAVQAGQSSHETVEEEGWKPPPLKTVQRRKFGAGGESEASTAISSNNPHTETSIPDARPTETTSPSKYTNPLFAPPPPPPSMPQLESTSTHKPGYFENYVLEAAPSRMNHPALPPPPAPPPSMFTSNTSPTAPQTANMHPQYTNPNLQNQTGGHHATTMNQVDGHYATTMNQADGHYATTMNQANEQHRWQTSETSTPTVASYTYNYPSRRSSSHSYSSPASATSQYQNTTTSTYASGAVEMPASTGWHSGPNTRSPYDMNPMIAELPEIAGADAARPAPASNEMDLNRSDLQTGAGAGAGAGGGPGQSGMSANQVSFGWESYY
ncbi:hypothetical protein Dda_8920 [Drechslerella dactyloides]|uniref:Uncharacterized protein n=1 Tax=Drechslerella dactyloides TaxID=74499 RepID=A0AAD6NFP5_DREDA|nr:hypothetical protein Dda_8920 [Drechslerella dactyloides]